ncbi:MAG TPA: hypothetical protein VFX76_05840, partial [Roseiflexaceae bacterium]|nr:hypothetical protein [Roseiflexaceae bacterium]
LGVILATIVLFMAVSSFLADTFNVAERLVPQNERDAAIRTFGVNLVIAVVGLMILAVMLWQARKLVHWRNNKKTE